MILSESQRRLKSQKEVKLRFQSSSAKRNTKPLEEPKPLWRRKRVYRRNEQRLTLQQLRGQSRKEEKRRQQSENIKMNFDLYEVTESVNEEGQFTGYLVRPRYVKLDRIPRMLTLNVPIKYDNNKLLDHIVSNNGINAV
jgi:hypothetical protein